MDPAPEFLLSTASVVNNISLADIHNDSSQLRSFLLSNRNVPMPIPSAHVPAQVPSFGDISHFARKTTAEPDALSNFSPDITTNKSFKEFDQLSEVDLRRIVELKMSKLDQFNNRVMNKKEKLVYKKYNLTPRVLETLIRCQRRIRAYVMKRKFFRALRMNDILENKQCVLELGQSLKRYKRKMEDSKAPFYDGILDFIM